MSLLKSNQLSSIFSLIKDKNQKKSFLYLIIRGISVISNYIISILIIQIFSKENYGDYVYGLSVFMLLSVILKFGVDVHFVKIFSKLKDKKIKNWIKRIEKRVLYISSITCALIISVLLFLELDKNYIIIFFVASAPFNVKILLNSGKLRGISNIAQFAFLNIAGRVLLTLIIFVALYYLFSFKAEYSIYIAHTISIIFLVIISIFWTTKEFKTLKEFKTSIIPTNFFSYNKSLLIKSYITVLFLWGDRFLLTLISNSSEVAQYDVSLKIAMLIMIVIEALKSTYAPVFASYASNHKHLKTEINKSTRIGFVICLFVFIFILLFGKFLLSLFGAEFVASYNTLLIISFGYTLASFFGQADNVLEMCGLIKYYIKYYFIIIFLSLIIGVLLSFNYGATGMAIGFAIGNIFFQSVASYIVKSKINIKTTFI